MNFTIFNFLRLKNVPVGIIWLIVLLISIHPCTSFSEGNRSGINWFPFSQEVFKKALEEKKLILMDVEAIWCHWCHVMDKETYSNAEIQQIISKNFIAVKVDQDSRPDISTRYQDYGWPATVVLSGEGQDLVKRSGYMPVDEMKEMLTEVIANPSVHEDKEEQTGVKVSDSSDGTLSEELRKKLISNHEYFFDETKGGLDFRQRFLNADSIEAILVESKRANARYEKFGRLTLTAALKLIDPAWGGAYQYSTDRDWDHAHFEKIGPTQALNMRSYANGYSQFGDAAYLAAARSIYNYLRNFLRSPEGAFYTSQDADLVRGVHSEEYFNLDDAARRKRGIPAIDKHTYSYENGLLITALCTLYAASADPQVLADAQLAAKFILANRALPEGGFRHDEKDIGGPYFRDTLAMAQAFLSLYASTGDRSLLEVSAKAADFMAANFTEANSAGFVSYSPKTAGILKPPRLQEENLAAARYFNILSHYTGKPAYHDQSLIALKWLSQPKIALQSKVEPGLLLADAEYHSPPIHITVVGHKDDLQALNLFRAALNYPSIYKRTEWWDKREGAMPNSDVEYPELPKAAAFVCTQRRCSLPIFAPEGIAKILNAKIKTAQVPK